MKKKILQKLAGIILPAFLVLVALFLAFKNYSFGSFLLGWDSLHPEFNFPLNFQRLFFGVWREEQGLGAISAHSHMADLVRVFILWISSFVLPHDLLRYLYVFLCLMLGPLGIYFFLKGNLEEKKNINIVSFLGASFYLLNLITLQHFFVPFEMFLVQYAFLPWIFLFAIKFIKERKKKDLVVFCLLTLLSAPMAYAATLFYVFLTGFCLFIFFYSLFEKNIWISLKRGIVLILITIILNLYWIGPNIYSVVNQSGTISSSRINTLFSPEAFLRNGEYGDVRNIATFKNFLFDWRYFSFQENQFNDLFSSWNIYLSDKWYIGYVFTGIALLGLFISLIKRNKTAIALLPVSLFSLFFIININPPTGSFYEYLYTKLPLLREGFRMPFTKFSLMYLFCFTFFLSFFFSFLFKILSKLKTFGKTLIFFIFISFSGILIYYNKPMFEGQLISSLVRTNLPNEYYEFFDYFSDKNGRIAKFPIYTIWGWEYHDWGYEGSGFIPFGLKNPTLDRDFDRWSMGNESFYNQASYYLYNKDLDSFEKILEKFQVKYLLLDESIINAGGDFEILFMPELKDLILKSKKIKEVKKIGFLTVYEVSFYDSDNFVFAPQNYVSLNIDQDYSQIDPIYENFGNYIFDENGVSYPFVNFDKRADIKIYEDNENLVFQNGNIYAKFPLKGKIVEDFSLNMGFESAYNCDLKKTGEVWKELKESGVWYKALGNGVSCDFFDYSNLAYNQGYVLRIKGENFQGRGLKIYLYNKKTTRMDLEELLPEGEFDEYFVILPKHKESSKEDKGYTLNLETRSFGRIASENKIELVEFIPVDVDFLTSLVSDAKPIEEIKNDLKIENVTKIGTSNYIVDYENKGLLVLGQGFDNGWDAYTLSGDNNNLMVKFLPFLYSKPLEHVKVNSWANGWIIPEGERVSIVFWPQYLEWGGMILGVVVVLLILASKKRQKS